MIAIMDYGVGNLFSLKYLKVFIHFINNYLFCLKQY